MEEYGRLGDFGLFQLFVCAFKHNVCDAETEDLVGFLKHFVSHLVGVVQFFAHSYELGTLSGEYKCFHYIWIKFCFLFLRQS